MPLINRTEQRRRRCGGAGPSRPYGYAALDSFVRPVFFVRGWILPAWHVFGVLGIVVGAAVFVVAGTYLELAWKVIAAVLGVNLATLVVPLLIARRISAAPKLVLLRSLLLALGATAAAAAWLRAPVLDALDAWVPGMAIFLAFGRLGCLMSGCCHGKPASFGVCYRWRVRRDTGAPERLEPIQAYESLLFFALMGWSLATLVGPHHPADPVIVFLATYGTARYGLEFRRGDRRPYLWRLSEAQWLSLACVFTPIAGAYALEPDRHALWMGACFLAAVALATLTALGFTFGSHRPLSR